MGYSDPVGDTVHDNWDYLALQEAKTYNTNPQSICFRYVAECDTYMKDYTGISNEARSGCRRSIAGEFTKASRDEYFHNVFSSNASISGGPKLHCHFPVTATCSGSSAASCKVSGSSVVYDGETQCKWSGGNCVPVEKWAGCASTKSACIKCSHKCKDYVSRETRAGAEAASILTMCTVAFTVAAVVWNNFITRGDNDEFTGVFSMIAYVINGGVLLVGLSLSIVCVIRLIQADAYFGLLLCLLFLGIFLLAAGGLAVFGIRNGNPGLINIASVFLAIFGYIMLIIAVILAVVSGTVMDEANASYDENYSAMRKTVEAVEPTFCQIPKADCEKITVFRKKDILIRPASKMKHDPAALWAAQYLAMATESKWIKRTYAPVGATKTLRSACAGDQVCVACSLLNDNVKQREAWHPKLSDSAGNSGKGGTNPVLYFSGVNISTVMMQLNEYEGKSPVVGAAAKCTNHRAATDVHTGSGSLVTFGYITGCSGKISSEPEPNGLQKCEKDGSPCGSSDCTTKCNQKCEMTWQFKSGDSGVKILWCPRTCTRAIQKTPYDCKSVGSMCKGTHFRVGNASKETATTDGCYSSAKVTPGKLNPDAQETKDALASYMKNVSTDWANRTRASSLNPDRRKRRIVSQITGRCNIALRAWSKTTSCKELYEKNTKNKQYADAGKSERFPRMAGCYDCTGAGGTVAPTFMLTADTTATRWQRAACLRAMYSVTASKDCAALAQEQECANQFSASSNDLKGRAACSSCAGTGCETHTKNACAYFEAFRLKMKNTFCQFTDASCQQKLNERTEDDLSSVAVVGVIFCVFFLFILYATYRGVITYMINDDDDME